MPLEIIDGPTIAAGESLSDGADCSAGDIVRITVPQEYTSAPLSFQVSSDGNGYNDLHLSSGQEVTMTAKADTGIIVHEVWARSINFIKFRSGTRDAPVPQAVDCKFAIAVETPTGAGTARAAADAAETDQRRHAADAAEGEETHRRRNKHGQ